MCAVSCCGRAGWQGLVWGLQHTGWGWGFMLTSPLFLRLPSGVGPGSWEAPRGTHHKASVFQFLPLPHPALVDAHPVLAATHWTPERSHLGPCVRQGHTSGTHTDHL